MVNRKFYTYVNNFTYLNIEQSRELQFIFISIILIFFTQNYKAKICSKFYETNLGKIELISKRLFHKFFKMNFCSKKLYEASKDYFKILFLLEF